ncbi:MAG TPA: hypothetical protein VF707_05095 [Ardenticatenaceae bacterium]|jgi:ABC-type sugar transport system permease subunit
MKRDSWLHHDPLAWPRPRSTKNIQTLSKRKVGYEFLVAWVVLTASTLFFAVLATILYMVVENREQVIALTLILTSVVAIPMLFFVLRRVYAYPAKMKRERALSKEGSVEVLKDALAQTLFQRYLEEIQSGNYVDVDGPLWKFKELANVKDGGVFTIGEHKALREELRRYSIKEADNILEQAKPRRQIDPVILMTLEWVGTLVHSLLVIYVMADLFLATHFDVRIIFSTALILPLLLYLLINSVLLQNIRKGEIKRRETKR